MTQSRAKACALAFRADEPDEGNVITREYGFAKRVVERVIMSHDQIMRIGGSSIDARDDLFSVQYLYVCWD